MAERDYWVTVCDACGCAACWQGYFYCDDAKNAGTVDVRASLLREFDREDPGYYSQGRLLDHCGVVRFADGSVKRAGEVVRDGLKA